MNGSWKVCFSIPKLQILKGSLKDFGINLIIFLIFLIWILTGSLKKCGYTLFSGIKGFLIRSWFVSNDKLAIIIDISYLNPDRILEEMWLHAFIRNQQFPQEKMPNPFKILIGSYQDLAQKYQRFSLGIHHRYFNFFFLFDHFFSMCRLSMVFVQEKIISFVKLCVFFFVFVFILLFSL